MFYPLDNLL